MSLIPWISTGAAVVAALAAIARWRVARQHNKVLLRQQAVLEEQLVEARAARAQSKPVDVQILDLTPGGGSGDYVDFNMYLVNHGTRQCRCTVTAQVAGEAVVCGPARVDLIPNRPPELVRVIVPRPRLGDLMSECNNETTLYEQTLVVRVIDGASPVEASWHEPIYDAETDRERHEIQQRYWRAGRGETTDADLRAEAIAERLRRLENPEENGPRDEWS